MCVYNTPVSYIAGYSPCMDNNGNCSHLCLQSRQSQGHVCVCPNGMVSSNGTGKSCKLAEK